MAPEFTVDTKEIIALRVKVELNRELTQLVINAINAAGDGGVDPFDSSQRAKLSELSESLIDALAHRGE